MEFRDYQDFASSDPSTRQTILAGLSSDSIHGVVFSRDQMRDLKRLYPATNPPVEVEVSVQAFHEAGDTLNVMRLAQRDGLRVMAVLAKYCDSGEDPVKVLIRMLSDQGYEVGHLVDWANEEG